jgi:hypothetical protein
MSFANALGHDVAEWAAANHFQPAVEVPPTESA